VMLQSDAHGSRIARRERPSFDAEGIL
jgi:hypothetical protein